jgi:transcriptional regulator with XRE-family HTH domain
MSHFVHNIVLIRELSRLKRPEFSKLLGVSDNVLYNIETGKTHPKLSIIQALAKAAGVKAEDLERRKIDSSEVKFSKAITQPPTEESQTVIVDVLEKRLQDKQDLIDALKHNLEKIEEINLRSMETAFEKNRATLKAYGHQLAKIRAHLEARTAKQREARYEQILEEINKDQALFYQKTPQKDIV